MRKFFLYFLTCCVLFLSVGCNEVEDASSASGGTTTTTTALPTDGWTDDGWGHRELPVSYMNIDFNNLSSLRSLTSALQQDNDSYLNFFTCEGNAFDFRQNKEQVQQVCDFLNDLYFPYFSCRGNDSNSPQDVFSEYASVSLHYLGKLNCLRMIGRPVFGGSLTIYCYAAESFPNDPPYLFHNSLGNEFPSEESFLEYCGQDDEPAYTFTVDGYEGKGVYRAGSYHSDVYRAFLITENSWIIIEHESKDQAYAAETFRHILQGISSDYTLTVAPLGEILDTAV